MKIQRLIWRHPPTIGLHCVVLLCAVAPPLAAQPLGVTSADTVAKLTRSWADAYNAGRADARVAVTGSSVSNAFAALAEKQTPLAVVPRAIRFKEAQACEKSLGQRPAEYKLAVNAVAVYVHASNPVSELTYAELEAIFTGKRRSWKKLGGSDAPIAAFGVETNTPFGALFAEDVLAGKGFTNDVRLLDPSGLMQALAKETNAIGFGPLAPAPGVRAVEIKRTFSSTPAAPGEETISNRAYPLSRFVYGYTDAAATSDALKAWLNWIRGDEGQQIARQAGYFALPARWRNTP